jgi:DNA mismatch endonuclease, patch repair protein
MSDQYPPPSSESVRRRMSRTKSTETRPERRLRSALHRRGARYRLQQSLLENRRFKADVVFSKPRVVVFIDGCFWHSCPKHASSPKANADWWEAKLQRNRDRDAWANSALVDAGWTVVRVWEHADVEAAADRILEILGAEPRIAQVVQVDL